MATFGLLHAAYSLTDGAKLLLGGFLLYRLMRRKSDPEFGTGQPV